jgi:hypothetical protein
MTTKPPVRFTEVNAVSLHHKAVHVPAFVTRTQTVPQLFLCIDHQTRFVIIMEGTETHQLFPALRESDAAAANEPHQLIRRFTRSISTLSISIRFRLFLKKLSRSFFGKVAITNYAASY